MPEEPAPAGAIAAQSAADIEEKILRFRKFPGPLGWLYSIVAATMTVVVIYQVGWGGMTYAKLLPLFLGLSLLTVFYLFPAWKSWSFERPDKPLAPWKKRAAWWLAWLDIPLGLVAAGCAFYLFYYADDLVLRAGDPSRMDIVVASTGLILLAEATRRSVGLPMAILAAIFVIYARNAHRLGATHPLYVRSKRWELILEQLWFGNEGVFDIPVQVAAKYVLVFVLLGAVFKYSGVGEFFINFAYALTGHRRGGPAKTAVLASAMMGTVSGSSIANAVTTGAFTIPMMRRVGYRPEFAAAVEASASTGGQIMPPIMGAAAFVMVEFLAIPYRTIVLAGIIPALCFFFGAWVMVHLEAKRRGLRSVPRSELPRVRELLKRDWYYLAPFVVLIGLLMDPTTDILHAAVYTLGVTILISFIRPATRLNLARTREVFDETARNMAGVTMACAAAGVIGGMVKLTGFGSKIVFLVNDWSGGIFLIALILTMIACLVLGMGLPTTATYVLVVTLAAPIIVNFPGHQIPNGLSVLHWTLVAHMFVFFYGVVADVTPPVALSAYAASGIAGSDQFKTGLEAFKISTNKFLVPFAFVFQPAFLLLGMRWTDPLWIAEFLFDLTFLFAGVLYIHAGLSRFMYTHSRWWEATFMFVAGVLMMFPTYTTTGIGAALAITATLANRRRGRAESPGIAA
ncbi:MAG TPA: TRAP transporter permease [Candidatus Thermoplasmatota archaeon]|nr:TRAP transporter permease [Candidatus Thermoplasmatota archaeon]